MIEDVVTREAHPVLPSGGQQTTPHAPQTNHVDSEPQPVDRKTLESTVARVQESIGQFNSSLKIEIDPDVNRVVVKVLNNQSGEVIRQIPAEEMLEIAKRLDASQALLFTKRT